MDFNVENYLKEIADQFAAASGTDEESALVVLCGANSFDKFDEVLGYGQLDVVRAQIKMVVEKMDSYRADKEAFETLTEQAMLAQKSVLSFLENSFNKKLIDEAMFKARTKQFIDATADNNLKEIVAKRANKLLGEQVFEM